VENGFSVGAKKFGAKSVTSIPYYLAENFAVK